MINDRGFDSVHHHGTITRYEVLSILESAIRLRTTTAITTPAQGVLTLEFSFAKQQ